MRARILRPTFWKHEELVSLPFEYRLLFIGLWGLADREGRLEDRPIRIRMEVFPCDQVDVEAGLDQLEAKGLIERYTVPSGLRLISIPGWKRQQPVHHTELHSKLPPPPPRRINTLPPKNTVTSPLDNGGHTVTSPGQDRDVTVPTRFNTDTDTDSDTNTSKLPPSPLFAEGGVVSAVPKQGKPKPPKQPDERDAWFAEFYTLYPRHIGRAAAAKSFHRRVTTRGKFESVMEGLKSQLNQLLSSEEQYRPYPSTWLNQERWTDSAPAPGPEASPDPSKPQTIPGYKPFDLQATLEPEMDL